MESIEKEDKDYVAIGEHYEKNQNKELVIVHFLNIKRPLSWVFSGLFFEVNYGNQYDKFDIKLSLLLPNRKKITIAKFEFEYGLNQIKWDTEIPWGNGKNEWNAFNLLFRKKYDGAFRFFIKASPTMNSIIIIDCSSELIQNLILEKPIEDAIHTTGFVTNSAILKIHEKIFKENTYDPKNNKNGAICACENDGNYKVIFTFLFNKLEIGKILAENGIDKNKILEDIEEFKAMVKRIDNI